MPDVLLCLSLIFHLIAILLSCNEAIIGINVPLQHAESKHILLLIWVCNHYHLMMRGSCIQDIDQVVLYQPVHFEYIIGFLRPQIMFRCRFYDTLRQVFCFTRWRLILHFPFATPLLSCFIDTVVYLLDMWLPCPLLHERAHLCQYIQF